jgi:hypothetical protein
VRRASADAHINKNICDRNDEDQEDLSPRQDGYVLKGWGSCLYRTVQATKRKKSSIDNREKMDRESGIIAQHVGGAVRIDCSSVKSRKT